MAPRGLDRGRVDSYHADGFLSPVRVLDEVALGPCRDGFERLEELPARARAGAEMGQRWVYELMTHAAILDAVESLIGPDLLAWGAYTFCKYPHDRRAIQWHQDAAYLPLEPAGLVTAWVALDDAGPANGCMWVVPGSHRRGRVPHGCVAGPHALATSLAVADIGQFAAEPVAIELRAGEMSLHSDLVVHGSEPNRSDARRCGIAIRYMPPDIRLGRRSGGHRAEAYLCRGRDRARYWGLLEPPGG